jgi:hypothetical protein
VKLETRGDPVRVLVAVALAGVYLDEEMLCCVSG